MVRQYRKWIIVLSVALCIAVCICLINPRQYCIESGCRNEKLPGKDYCQIHYDQILQTVTTTKSTERSSTSSYHSSTSSNICEQSDCTNKRISGSRYCGDHTCRKDGCTNLRYNNGTVYCDTHAAIYASEQGYSVCSKSGCYRKRSSHGLYCDTHSCRKKDCYNIVADGSNYCSSHTNHTTSTPNTSSSKGTSRQEYTDPYEADKYTDSEDFYEDHYDDFDGFEDAEDYWLQHSK